LLFDKMTVTVRTLANGTFIIPLTAKDATFTPVIFGGSSCPAPAKGGKSFARLKFDAKSQTAPGFSDVQFTCDLQFNGTDASGESLVAAIFLVLKSRRPPSPSGTDRASPAPNLLHPDRCRYGLAAGEGRHDVLGDNQ
jgi:hypothetical protein